MNCNKSRHLRPDQLLAFLFFLVFSFLNCQTIFKMESTKKKDYEDQEALLTKGDRDASFLEKGSRDGSSVWRRPFRLILEIVMALMIVALLVRPYTNLKSIKPSPVPDCKFPPSSSK